ncbi:uncharacterized protein LOC130891776 [Diorhabda carinulata]|uniref:uncharacterized protein LOC130891776 n=1 Tax=Diorhabda carinulata TaxID=1163345 RepID=UPI0025A2C044|nr:uncharacterized protein LOC130891776 [Diorhabda carinulata]
MQSLMCVECLYIIYIANLLEKRYNFISFKLNDVINISDRRNKCLLVYKIVKLLKICFKIMEKANIIFGLQFFTFVVVVMVDGCYTISFSVYTDADIETKLMAVIGDSIYLVYLLAVIIACNNLEKSGYNVVDKFYELASKKINKDIKNDLLLCADYAATWRPVFSAAGFFDIRQTNINILLSNMISYLIATVQSKKEEVLKIPNPKTKIENFTIFVFSVTSLEYKFKKVKNRNKVPKDMKDG